MEQVERLPTCVYLVSVQLSLLAKLLALLESACIQGLELGTAGHSSFGSVQCLASLDSLSASDSGPRLFLESHGFKVQEIPS
jgi:hypothetical protein